MDDRCGSTSCCSPISPPSRRTGTSCAGASRPPAAGRFPTTRSTRRCAAGLTDLARRDAFVADPEALAARTVEEILRFTSPGGLGLLRYAREDVEIDGQVIARGDAVLLAVGAANRDGAAFDDPDEFDPTRAPNPHVASAHGAHYCIGASLARTLEEIAVRDDRVTGGVGSVPVTW